VTSPPRAILFDFDGTLATLHIDFEAMRREVRELVTRVAPDFVESQPRWTLELIEAVTEQLNPHAAEFRAAAFQMIEQVELRAASTSHWLPGAREALVELRQREIKLGVVTRNCRRAVVAITGGTDWCEVLFTRDDVARVKPNPEHLLTALRSLKVRPDEALMVGDHAQDMVVARAAGLQGVGVLSGSSSREALLEAGALAVLNSVAELPPWLTTSLCPSPPNCLPAS